MRFIVMFVTAVRVLFLIKLRWLKKKSINDIGSNLLVTEPGLSRPKSIHSGIMSLLLKTPVIKEAVAWLLAKWGSCGCEGQSS